MIAIENVRLFKELEERNAELREAWSIRRRRPRCSESSAARRPMCSRCSTPSSRAPRGFVGIDDVVLRLHEGNAMVAAGHFGAIPLKRHRCRDQYRCVSSIAGYASTARSTFPTSRAQNDFPNVGFRRQRSVPSWPSPSSQGELIGTLGARRMEVRPFTHDADQAARNLRRPSGDRHRERTTLPGTRRAQRRIARGAGASDGDGRGARHHQPLADRRAAGARRYRRERRASLWDR